MLILIFCYTKCLFIFYFLSSFVVEFSMCVFLGMFVIACMLFMYVCVFVYLLFVVVCEFVFVIIFNLQFALPKIVWCAVLFFDCQILVFSKIKGMWGLVGFMIKVHIFQQRGWCAVWSGIGWCAVWFLKKDFFQTGWCAVCFLGGVFFLWTIKPHITLKKNVEKIACCAVWFSDYLCGGA